jgi:hypothetical protein
MHSYSPSSFARLSLLWKFSFFSALGAALQQQDAKKASQLLYACDWISCCMPMIGAMRSSYRPSSCARLSVL